MASADHRIRRGNFFWFLALWLIGTGGAFLLALPFEILMHWAMR